MSRRLGTAVLAIVLGVMVIVAMLPFVLMFVTSIQSTSLLGFGIDWSAVNLNNYVSLFVTHQFGSRILTTIIVVVIACVVNIVTASLAAFAFAKKPFPGSRVLFWVFLATMMVPAQATLIPLYTIMRQIGLLNTYVGLALPVITAFGVFLMKQFADQIPDELIEAARIDGAPDRTVFLRIVVPVLTPVIVALTIFTFLAAWNDFLWPLISVSRNEMTTVTLALAGLEGRSSTNYGLVMAGAAVSFLGPFLAYVILQRRFVEGIAFSGIKG